jgi:hypothetical protein
MGILIGLGVARFDLKIYRSRPARYERLYFLNILMDQLAILPCIAGWIFVFSDGPSRLYGLVPAIIYQGNTGCLVLPVEINR